MRNSISLFSYCFIYFFCAQKQAITTDVDSFCNELILFKINSKYALTKNFHSHAIIPCRPYSLFNSTYQLCKPDSSCNKPNIRLDKIIPNAIILCMTFPVPTCKIGAVFAYSVNSNNLKTISSIFTSNAKFQLLNFFYYFSSLRVQSFKLIRFAICKIFPQCIHHMIHQALLLSLFTNTAIIHSTHVLCPTCNSNT